MKWFKFDQNNSFGVFEVNDKVCHDIFIEAENYKEARKKLFLWEFILMEYIKELIVLVVVIVGVIMNM